MTGARGRSALLTLALVGATACGAERACRDWCGTLVAVTYSDARTLLPPLTVTDNGTALSDLLFLKLADIGPGLNTVGDSGFVPLLADSWTFDDSLTIRFSLNPEARWHDGAPVVAEDVSFTYDVYRDPRVNSINRFRLREIASVTAADSTTVVFKFRRWYPEQLFDAVYHMRVIPHHLLSDVPREQLATDPFGRQPIGSGPFHFVRWQLGESGELAADSTFFLGRPGLRRFVWRVTPDPVAALTQLVAGEGDLLNYVFPTPTNIRLVEEAEHLHLEQFRSNTYNYIGFNFKDPARPERPHPLFGNRELRRAIAMAVDRRAVVRAVLGEYGEVLPGPITRISWVWRDDLAQLPYDTARARATLARLGWRDSNADGVLDLNGRPLRFELAVPNSSTSRVQASVIVQAQLKQLGIDMQIGEYEFATFVDRVQRGEFDAQFSSIGQDPSPISIEDWTSAGLGAFNYGSYVNSVFDSLIAVALNESDRTRARDEFKRAIDLMNGDAPAVWIVLPRIVAAVHARLDNVSFRPDAWWATVWTWRVTPSQAIMRDLVTGSAVGAEVGAR